MNEPGRREVDPRWVFLIGALVLAALPFASVEFIPGTDLPQHAAQIRLLREVWGLSPASTDLSNLETRPLGGNTLCYWPLLVLSTFASPPLAIKLCVFFWVAAAIFTWHMLAWRRDRSPAVALVTSTLLFGLPLYWGLLNFISGLAAFFLFCDRALKPPARARSDAGVNMLLVAVLYFAHVLWVGVAAALTVVLYVRDVRGDRHDAVHRLVPFLPVAGLAAGWLKPLIAQRAASGFVLEPEYLTPFSERLSPSWLASSLFGGIRGPFEPIIVACIVGYALISALRARKSESKRHATDRALVTLGLAGIAFAMLAPDQFLNTLLFNDRYLGYSAMFLLLGLPHPGGRALTAGAAILACVFSLGTTAAWIVYDEGELSGLRPSLAAIDRPRRVLGLDYRKHSDVLRDRPFMQLFAYTQAAHGGELSFSFAAHQSSIVSYREPPQTPWTPGLEWKPETATDRDIAAFDCVLVNGTDAQHAAFAARFGANSPVTEGYFRSYCHPRAITGESKVHR